MVRQQVSLNDLALGRDGEVKEAVRVARFVLKTELQEAEAVEARRTDGSTVPIYLVWRRQPHGGAPCFYDAGDAKGQAELCMALRSGMTVDFT
jgi:hypothetical protein